MPGTRNNLPASAADRPACTYSLATEIGVMLRAPEA